MEAIRTVTTVKNHQIRVDVPRDFEQLEVEVIVFPVKPRTQEKRETKAEFLKFLQQGPTLSEEEIKNIEAVGQEFQKWTIQEFGGGYLVHDRSVVQTCLSGRQCYDRRQACLRRQHVQDATAYFSACRDD